MTSKKEIRKSFAGYKNDGANWITLATGEYYPDILKDDILLFMTWYAIRCIAAKATHL